MTQSSADGSPSRADEPVLNLVLARRRLGGDEQLLKDLAAFFFDDAPVLVDELRSDLTSGKFEEAARAAHSLRGLAANFDASSAMRVAQAAEDAARAGDREGLSRLVESLSVEITRVIASLKREVI